MTHLVLTDDQQKAKEAFTAFLMDPDENVFVLSGFSGTGKSTLVRDLLNNIDKINKTVQLINPKAKPNRPIQLTATTNKAADALSFITGRSVQTIHSFLNLRVHTDYKTQKTTVVPQRHATTQEGLLLFIDEASFIDSNLLEYIFKFTNDCKIVFIGDPAQLTPVKSSNVPVFNAGFPGAQLRNVVRQGEGNPIIDLSTKFREAVETGNFFSFQPDGQAIQHLPRQDFESHIIQEFTDPRWNDRKSKVLAWRNKTVVAYNKAIRSHVKGDPEFKEDDYAICNRYMYSRKGSIKTDELVHITQLVPAHRYLSDTNETIEGYEVTLNNWFHGFLPKHIEDRKRAINVAKKRNDYVFLQELETEWLDLRAAYACTINKSQGSTYDRVFIDLDDIKRCNSGNQLARMLYVAVSRARHNVYFTGDLV